MSDPTRNQDHAGHDPLLIAGLASRDLAGPDVARATTLVATCDDCAELLADLRAIARATAALPAPARTRDFRLDPGDVVRIRPAGWRRLVAAFGSPRLALASPLAGGLAALGLAALLVGTVPSIGPGAGGGDPAAVPTREGGTALELSGDAGQALGSPSATNSDRPPSAALNVEGTVAPAAQPGEAQSGGTYRTAAPTLGGDLGAISSPGTKAGAPMTDGAAGSAGETAGPGRGTTDDLYGFGATDPPDGGLIAGYATDVADRRADRSPFVIVGFVLLGIGLGLFALRRLGRRVAG